MTEHNDSDTTVNHTDEASQHVSHSHDGEYSVDLTYKHKPNQDESKQNEQDRDDLGPISVRGPDFSIDSEEITELKHYRHLTVQLREANRKRRSKHLSSMAANEIAAEFDAEVQQLAQWVLDVEGTSFAELPIKECHSRAILLHDVWQMESCPALEEYLAEKDSEYINQIIGYDSAPTYSTFWRKMETLNDAECRETLQRAATQAVHAICRNAVALPEEVAQAYGLDIEPILDERTISMGTHRAATLAWIDYLLDELLEPVSFDRADNTQYSVREIVATIAQAAYAEGLDSAPRTAGWYYDEDNIPSPGRISQLLTALNRNEIAAMFSQVTQRFIDLASQLGFFADEARPAIDTTWVTWGGDGNPDDRETKLIKNPDKCKTGKGWCFAAICLMNRQNRFGIGVDLVADKSTYNQHFRGLLHSLGQDADIGRIHGDREFESGKMVTLCRAIAEDNWGIRIRSRDRDEDYGDIQEVVDETPKGETNFERNVSFADLTKDPNVYVHPIPSRLQDRYSVEKMVFLTDLTPDNDSDDLSDLFETYQKRWTIETYFRQLKHGFCPDSHSDSPELRLFLFNIATLFFNVHSLMNRATAPEYGLRLDVRYYDVLLAIVESTFPRTAATDL